jgi:hypothetical protein
LISYSSKTAIFDADQKLILNQALSLLQNALTISLEISISNLKLMVSNKNIEIFSSFQYLLLNTSSVVKALSGNSSMSGNVTLTADETDKVIQLITSITSTLQSQGMQKHMSELDNVLIPNPHPQQFFSRSFHFLRLVCGPNFQSKFFHRQRRVPRLARGIFCH